MIRTIVLLIALIDLTAMVADAAGIDRNGNGMSDVWEMLYAAGALSPNNDADQDSFTNLEEARAGTNPFDPASFPKLRARLLSPENGLLTWESVAGKRYTVQSRISLTGAWSNEWQLIGASASTEVGFISTNGPR